MIKTQQHKSGMFIILSNEIQRRLDSYMSAKSIENFVHGDAPWKQCENHKIIDYNFVFNRIPPFSHLNYDNEFIQNSARDIIKNLGTISKKEVDYYENL